MLKFFFFFIFSWRIRSHIIQLEVLITNMNDKRLITCSVRTLQSAQHQLMALKCYPLKHFYRLSAFVKERSETVKSSLTVVAVQFTW